MQIQLTRRADKDYAGLSAQLRRQVDKLSIVARTRNADAILPTADMVDQCKAGTKLASLEVRLWDQASAMAEGQ